MPSSGALRAVFARTHPVRAAVRARRRTACGTDDPSGPNTVCARWIRVPMPLGPSFASSRRALMNTICDESRVLVVDDDPNVAEALRHLRLAEGYRCR